MPRGGARNRSGPQPDENSLRSAAKGLVLTALPATGYSGSIPEFPLPKVLVYFEYFEDKKKIREYDDGATEARRERELTLWAWAWRTPQAAAWAAEPWRWHSVAMWVRTSALCESSDATAADKNSLHRFADQIGLTPAGLKENGWKVAPAEGGEKPAGKTPARKAPSSRDRFTVIDGGGAA